MTFITKNIQKLYWTIFDCVFANYSLTTFVEVPVKGDLLQIMQVGNERYRTWSSADRSRQEAQAKSDERGLQHRVSVGKGVRAGVCDITFKRANQQENSNEHSN